MNSIEQRMEDAREWARKITGFCKDYGGFIIERDIVEYLAEYKMIADWYQSDMRMLGRETTELLELREFYNAAQARKVQESNLVKHQDGDQSGQAAKAGCSYSIKYRAKGKEEVEITKVYIAGPMTGYDEHNFPAFHAAAARIRRHVAAVNPAELNEITDPIRLIVQRDVGALLTCDAICLLTGWSTSRGAVNEHSIATWMQMPVLTLEDFPS
jgi:hypothetical protein